MPSQTSHPQQDDHTWLVLARTFFRQFFIRLVNSPAISKCSSSSKLLRFVRDSAFCAIYGHLDGESSNFSLGDRVRTTFLLPLSPALSTASIPLETV